MKCERCGKLIGVTRRGQALFDGYICYRCLDELGFENKGDYKRGIKPWTLAYWEIKDGPARINYNRAARIEKHEEWKRNNPELAADMAAFFEALDGSDENDENQEDIDIDEA